MTVEEDLILRCLIIMPYSKTSDIHTDEYWQNHYHKFLKPLIEEVPNIEAFRVKPIRGDIIKQIITNLVVSPMIVAELTDHNPNVFWELGVRQSFKHNTITIAEEGTPLPFDISIKATLFYDPKNHLKMESFRKKFKKALELCKSNPDESDSHVLETISGRGSLFEIMRHDEAKRRVKALISELKTNQTYWKTNERTHRSNSPPVVPFGVQFQTSAIELLITNRYLDESERFYTICENYFAILLYFNARVSWLRDLKKLNAFIEVMKKANTVDRVFAQVMTQFETIYNKLTEKILIGI